jgi:nuclear pore complex protein Nup85
VTVRAKRKRRVRDQPCLRMTAIRLYPPLFEEGKDAEFLQSGRTLAVSQSPRDNSVAVFATNTVVCLLSTSCLSIAQLLCKIDSKALKTLREKYPESQDIYTASTDNIPSSERRLVRGMYPDQGARLSGVKFLTETSVVFASLQDFKNNQRGQDSRLFVISCLQVTNYPLRLFQRA